MPTSQPRPYGPTALSAGTWAWVPCGRSARLLEPVDTGVFYKNLFRPALEAVGLPASRSATADNPAVLGIRLHDLRHTFATLQLSAGEAVLVGVKWLGHSTYTLTLDVYGDWIPKDDDAAANSLPEPVAPAKRAALPENVVSLFGSAG